MGIEQIIFLIVGIISVVAGLTGMVTKTRKGRRWSKLIGEAGVKALNVVIGIILIVLAFFI